MKPSGSHREIVLNIETTGFEQKGENPDCIIEIGAIEIIDKVHGREFHRLVNPNGVTVSKFVTEKTGLSNEKLDDKPRFSDPIVVDQFLEFIGDSHIVTHNVSLDRGFINAELQRANREIIPDENWIDTLELARYLFPASKNSLSKLSERFEILVESHGEREGGLADCKLLVKVYKGLKECLVPEMDAVDLNERARNLEPTDNTILQPAAPFLTETERDHHKKFLLETFEGNSIWNRFNRV